MREYIVSASRHLSGAATGALVAFLAGHGLEVFTGEMTAELERGIEALLMGLGLACYALVEKALKPVATRFFGSAGV